MLYSESDGTFIEGQAAEINQSVDFTSATDRLFFNKKSLAVPEVFGGYEPRRNVALQSAQQTELFVSTSFCQFCGT